MKIEQGYKREATVRIERHEVGAAALDAAVEGFAERIEGEVHRMSNHDVPEYGWWLVSESFLDYVAARSVRDPGLLGGKDCRLAFQSAATAAIGSTALWAGLKDRARVIVEYTGSGMIYEDDAEVPADAAAPPRHWLNAFYLNWISGAQEDRLLVDAAPTLRGHTDRADIGLVHALMALAFGHIEGQDPAAAARGTSDAERLALIDSVVDGVGPGTDLPGHRAALTALRALAAGDRPGYHRALTALLEHHHAQHSGEDDPAPRTLLPLDAITLASLGRWGGGEWRPNEIDSDYLPEALVRCFDTGEPRVLTYGRKKRADAVEALAAGPIVVDRPPHPAAEQADLAQYDEYARQQPAEFREAGTDADKATGLLLGLTGRQLRRFRLRAAVDPQGRDERQQEALLSAAEAGAAALRLMRAEAGTEVDITVGGTTHRLTATGGRSAGPHPYTWLDLVALALITGQRELLAACVLTDPEILARSATAGAAYGQALQDYLRGADPEPALERAVRVIAPLRDTTFVVPPVVLLSQLVEGDREGFALALADALEAHREHYEVGDLGKEAEAALSLDILALVCHARRMGWPVPVVSPYLPEQLIKRNSLVSGHAS
ncbi:Imm49 family immunity protein [Streptomyces sp. NPDC048258]|uniref:immunity 49 family protein n=1 Tax=Streptomyces sp. NPDC048258 TaxID=3365527 RepID=UPI003716AD94